MAPEPSRAASGTREQGWGWSLFSRGKTEPHTGFGARHGSQPPASWLCDLRLVPRPL